MKKEKETLKERIQRLEEGDILILHWREESHGGTEGIKLVHTELVRDSWLFPQVSIHSPEDLVSAMQSLLSNLDREMLVSVPIRISIGNHEPRRWWSLPEYTRTAILAGANHIFLLHNHPSGRPEPSKEDLRITKRMQKPEIFWV